MCLLVDNVKPQVCETVRRSPEGSTPSMRGPRCPTPHSREESEKGLGPKPVLLGGGSGWEVTLTTWSLLLPTPPRGEDNISKQSIPSLVTNTINIQGSEFSLLRWLTEEVGREVGLPRGSQTIGISAYVFKGV